MFPQIVYTLCVGHERAKNKFCNGRNALPGALYKYASPVRRARVKRENLLLALLSPRDSNSTARAAKLRARRASSRVPRANSSSGRRYAVTVRVDEINARRQLEYIECFIERER